jgi:hypothetical protein
MANDDLKAANQAQGPTNTPASAAHQPISSRGAVDRDRIKAQIRRWQDRVLDLTKSNPLIGLNRSRVAKLQVIEPAAERLFGTFAVEENHLRMPLVRKRGRQPEQASLLDVDQDPDLSVEPGDVSQISITMNLYSHVIPAMQQEVAARLDAILAPPPPPDGFATNPAIGEPT